LVSIGDEIEPLEDRVAKDCVELEPVSMVDARQVKASKKNSVLRLRIEFFF
jgi:hypothetical protein